MARLRRRGLLGSRRDGAADYLLITLVTFAVTVAAVRWYLELTGFPKIGGGGIHVAHMLWGGLLLIVGALLPLLFVGRRVLRVSALLTGIGVGLFIDEVGKFITESNDYFFSPAAPIIYGGVLLVVLLWLMVRRGSRGSTEVALQAAAEALQIGIDGQLTADHRDRVSASLREAGTALPPDDVALGEQILAALESPEMDARLAAPGWTARNHPSALSARLLPTSVERVVILVGLAWNVLLAVLATIVLLASDEIGSVSVIPQPEGPVEIPTEPL